MSFVIVFGRNLKILHFQKIWSNELSNHHWVMNLDPFQSSDQAERKEKGQATQV